MQHTKFRQYRSTGRFLKGVYHIWTRRPSCSCDQHHVNKFSFPCTQDKTRQDKFITLNPYTHGNIRNNGEIDDTGLDNILHILIDIFFYQICHS